MIWRCIGGWAVKCVRVLGIGPSYCSSALLGRPLGFLRPLPLKLAVDSKVEVCRRQ